jgi:hypothetical protein
VVVTAEAIPASRSMTAKSLIFMFGSRISGYACADTGTAASRPIVRSEVRDVSTRCEWENPPQRVG